MYIYIYIYKLDLTLGNQQKLICLKTNQPTNLIKQVLTCVSDKISDNMRKLLA